MAVELLTHTHIHIDIHWNAKYDYNIFILLYCIINAIGSCITEQFGGYYQPVQIIYFLTISVKNPVFHGIDDLIGNISSSFSSACLEWTEKIQATTFSLSPAFFTRAWKSGGIYSQMSDYEGCGVRPLSASLPKEGYAGICLRGCYGWTSEKDYANCYCGWEKGEFYVGCVVRERQGLIWPKDVASGWRKEGKDGR